ncbi:MAG: glycosyltransferase family 1 protein [Gemmatirosa sp.]|nr:glycosyltransferase family 1 protein [Gemmatirosa sp.]
MYTLAAAPAVRIDAPPRRTHDVGDLSDVRVALFSDTYAPQLNGVARTLARLVHALRERGAEAHVVTTTDPRAPRTPPNGGDAERWASVPCPRYPELRLALPRAARARRLLGARRQTLAHVATPFGVGLAARQAARAAGVPLVTSYHTSFGAYARSYGLGMLEAPSWRYLRWFHDGGRRTYAPTAAIAAELEAHGFANVAVWGRGVDVARFAPSHRSEALRASWGAASDDVVVAYIGRVAREKGLDLALDALRLAQQRLARQRLAALPGGRVPNVRLVIVGDGPYLAACRARAPEGTVFTGRLDGAALSAAFASADVFLFPSETDTFGNVLLEAMASGCAIVAVDVAPTRELLDGGARGLLAPASVDTLSARLAWMATAAWRRAELATVGRAHAETQSWRAVFDGLFVDYRRVLHDAACAPRAR